MSGELYTAEARVSDARRDGPGRPSGAPLDVALRTPAELCGSANEPASIASSSSRPALQRVSGRHLAVPRAGAASRRGEPGSGHACRALRSATALNLSVELHVAPADANDAAATFRIVVEAPLLQLRRARPKAVGRRSAPEGDAPTARGSPGQC